MKPLLPHPPRPHLALTHARSHSYSHPPTQLIAPSLDHAQSEGEMEEDEDDEDDEDDDYVDEEQDVEMESHTPPSTEEEDENEDENEDSEDSEDDVQEPFIITQPEAPGRDQPQQLKKQRRRATSQEAAIVCANCGQTQTPLWRKDSQGRPICNACGLYSRLHQRDRPITMRKAKIARRKRDWTQDKEKGSEKNSNKATKKRKEKTESNESPASAPSMNIPVNTEHDSGDEAMPTPVSSASMSPNLSGMPSMPQGPLSPSLTASPPTPVLSPPNMLFNSASSFPGLNPLLLQQYQQHLQNQSTMNMIQQNLLQQQQSGMSVSHATPGEAILGNNWLSQLYPAYPPASVPFLASSTSLNDASLMALANMQQQQQQQQQHQEHSKPFQSKP
ncbi:putative electron transfer flavoprotein subunit, partial [Podila epicladia]